MRLHISVRDPLQIAEEVRGILIQDIGHALPGIKKCMLLMPQSTV